MEINSAMEPASTPISVIDELKQYIQTKLTLLKYEGIERASGIIAGIVTDLVLVTILFVSFIFLSITLALFAGQLLGSLWAGFGSVTVLYLLIALIVRGFKISLQNTFIRILIKKVFKKN